MRRWLRKYSRPQQWGYLDMKERDLFSGKEIIRDLEHALKCVRGLYYQGKIFRETQGRQGKQVEFGSLSGEDRNALVYVRTHHDGVPPEITSFVKRIMKDIPLE